MAEITVNYNSSNSLLQNIIQSAILAGDVAEKYDEPKEKNEIMKQYESIFGKKKQYTDNDVFVYNSMINISKILARDENKST
ncbi:MAG: hypothetical protein LBN18_04820 [Dysgonamonadaceae bacterium]|jgi:hypothetical protein|nr:hypothetical protein [Dysgonamonadaceae bacterium]